MSPVVLINVFVPKSGQVDEFIAAQTTDGRRLVPDPESGFLGGEWYRALDGQSVISVARFASAEHHQRWIKTAAFTRHVETIKPLIERANPGYYELVYRSRSAA